MTLIGGTKQVVVRPDSLDGSELCRRFEIECTGHTTTSVHPGSQGEGGGGDGGGGPAIVIPVLSGLPTSWAYNTM